ncbi:MAG: M61 family metallopeptidase [Roseivirga sp.]|nr:M61 family metallopeptidase [Roseivirga sp.]
MDYKFSFTNPNSHFINISLRFDAKTAGSLIRLPSWRPGRYQIQNFAKNVKDVQAKDERDKTLSIKKVSKDTWKVENQPGLVTISYSYYAFIMDAGNSWLDDEQLYINFINCAMYVEGCEDSVCRVSLEVSSDYRVATGLEQIGTHQYAAPSYYQLVDSPLMASSSLRKVSYEVDSSTFNIWVQGDLPRTDEELVDDFKPFTKLQMKVMGGFPCKEYHFLCQCLPYKHYHGVEHWNSTVITLGPSSELKERPLYKEFLGVSSHELFHTWNVIRLRPEEMMPYNFQSENYHETGFVTEGVTTYYGDLFLARSGVFSRAEYLAELNKLLKRHYDNEGRKHYSVAASSYDLWLDGYERGIPGRKVSIYNEGALAALILDLKIRLKTDSKKSLDDVMRLMWNKHGKDLSGYSFSDYQNAAEHIYGGKLNAYFEEIVCGTKAYEHELELLLSAFGLAFELKASVKTEEAGFGIRIVKHGHRYFIDQIAAGSTAETSLSAKDEILTVNGVSFEGEWPGTEEIDLEVNRFGRKLVFKLTKETQIHFPIYQVAINEQAREAEKGNLEKWIGG